MAKRCECKYNNIFHCSCQVAKLVCCCDACWLSFGIVGWGVWLLIVGRLSHCFSCLHDPHCLPHTPSRPPRPWKLPVQYCNVWFYGAMVMCKWPTHFYTDIIILLNSYFHAWCKTWAMGITVYHCTLPSGVWSRCHYLSMLKLSGNMLPSVLYVETVSFQDQ